MNEQCKKCANCYEKAQKENWKYGCPAGYQHIRPDGRCNLFEKVNDERERQRILD